MTSIFDIAGVVPTQKQAEKIEAGNLIVSSPAPQREDLIGDNQLLSRLANQRGAQVGRGFGVTPSMADVAKQAYSQFRQASPTRVPDRVTQVPVSNAHTYRNLLNAPHLSTFGSTDLRDKMAEALAAGGTGVYGKGVHQGLLMGVKDAPTGFYGGKTYTGYGMYDPNDPTSFYGGDDDRPQVVLPETDAATGAKRCSDGYIFDEQLQACRLATTLPNQPEPTAYNFYQMPYEDEGLLGGYGANLFYG